MEYINYNKLQFLMYQTPRINIYMLKPVYISQINRVS